MTRGLLVGMVGLSLGACLPRPVVSPAAATKAAPGELWCGSYVLGREGPRCLFPLTEEQAQHRAYSYRMVQHEGRAERIERLNGHGVLSPDDQGIQTEELRYGDGFYEIIERGLKRRFLATLRHDGGKVWRFDEQGNPHPRPGTRHSISLRSYNDQGLVDSIRSLDDEGRPTPAEDGTLLQRTSFHPSGWVSERSFFDANGAPMATRDGYQRFTESPRRPGEPSEIRYFSAGEPFTLADGAHRIVVLRDRWDNVAGRDYFDAAGQPVLTTQGARVRYVRDSWGSVLETRHLGVRGEPALDGDRIHRIVSTYEEHGRLASSHFFGTDGAPTRNTEGVFGFEREYDAGGQVVEIRFLGADGQLAENNDGVALERFRIAKNGNVEATQLLDPARKPISGGRVALIRHSWEGQKMTQESFFDSAGQPALNASGYAEVHHEYDPEGKRHDSFFDARGERVMVRGIAQILVGCRGSPRSLPFVTRSREEARALAEQLAQKLREGVAFETLARAYSDDLTTRSAGGFLGVFAPGFLPLDVDVVLGRTRVGAVSEVVERPMGFLLLRRTR